MQPKHSYFDFLLDKTGGVLKKYLESKEKDPPPWMLCKQFIEKSLSVASAASLAQPNTEYALKVYEAQRIWQPLCLAMTVLSHLKWDLDAIQKSIPLHLQQILMEELLKGYGISMVPKPEDFDINKYGERGAMVHIIYNRWVVRTITKYEVMKEKDVLPTGLSSAVKETKELQEQQIFTKIKEYRNLSLDILEKSLFLESDCEIPYPMPRLVTEKEIIPQVDESIILKKPESNDVDKKDTISDDLSIVDGEDTRNESDKSPQNGTIMKVPPLLEEPIPVSATECILKICYDLGCYYFPKELYGDAWRVFQKAFELACDDYDECDWYRTMLGYYEACCLMLDKSRPEKITKRSDLCYRLEECSRVGYKDVEDVLITDNLERVIPYVQRQHLEDELYRLDKKDALFTICTLNFIRWSLEDRIVSFAFFDALVACTKDELIQFFKHCRDCHRNLTSEELQKKLKNGVRMAALYLSDDQRNAVKDNVHYKAFYEEEDNPKKKQKKECDISSDGSIESMSPEQNEPANGKIFPGLESDDRISPVVQLKARLVYCFNPETIKDILYELHETDPDQSHCQGYECEMYQEIFSEVQDLLMFDTIHVCITKSKQLSLQGNYPDALSILNVCLETLNKYAKRASPGCSVGRVKNILHHELLWIELKLTETCPDKSNEKETMRRSKACIQHTQQDPPPRPHIYQAIVIHLLNNKEYSFLVDAVSSYDILVVDFLQIGFHLSSVICGGGKHTDALKGLWEAVLKIVGELPDHDVVAPINGPLPRARGPAEEMRMWSLKCYVTKEEFLSLLLNLKDDHLISLMLSCLTSLLRVALLGESEVDIKDSFTHKWPTAFEGKITATPTQVLSVLKPFCNFCLEKCPHNLTWLRVVADVCVVEGNYARAMWHYLEIGSVSTSYFNRPVPFNIWDDKVYRNMILCCHKQEAFTQVIIFCQFTDPVDYDTAFKAIHKESSDDGMDTFYDCIWDVNIFEYLIHAHHKKGEIEKRKLAVSTLGQPELNCRGSPEILKQSQDIRKTKFLRSLTRFYWR